MSNQLNAVPRIDAAAKVSGKASLPWRLQTYQVRFL